MIVIVWREVGFGIILFLARLLSLPEEQIEAARIDGAGWWSRLRYVILPELRGTIEFYCVIAAITMLAWVFGYVWTLTSGGPGDATTVLELYIYNQGLRNSLPGMASAVAVLLMGVTMIFVALLFYARRRAARGRGRLMAFDELVGPLDQTAPAEPRWRRLSLRRASSGSSCSSARRSSRSTRSGS